MAIEIRELKITGYINKASKTNNQIQSTSFSEEQINALSKRVKAECIEAVLEILERKNRR